VPYLSMLLVGVFAVACGARRPRPPEIPARGDGWTLVLRRASLGPLEYTPITFNQMRYKPVRGERFITVAITLRNDTTAPRRFNFDRCDLDGPDGSIVPNFVDDSSWTQHQGEREVEVPVGETIARKLIYAYPSDRFPTRLSCAPMEFPIVLR